jgi:hypothetical protein
MPSIADVRNWLTILQIVGYVLLLRKLFVLDLFHRYRYFGFLVVVEAGRLPLMASLPPRSDLYAYVYFLTAPFIWVLYILVVLEFFQIILENHVGIATLGKKAVAGAIIMSVGVSGGTLLFDLQRTSTKAAFLFNYMLLERMVMMSLLVMLLCLVAFAAYFPIPVRSNIRVHASIFAVYFTVRTAVLFLRVFFGLEAIVVINIALNLLAIGCLFAWTALLKADGETAPAIVPPSIDEERLMAKLESINDSLMGSAKK